MEAYVTYYCDRVIMIQAASGSQNKKTLPKEQRLGSCTEATVCNLPTSALASEILYLTR